MSVKPLKRFGQNYLVDHNILNKIAAEIDPQEDQLLLEIGPGRGALTEKLAERGGNIYAVEIDKRVIEELTVRFPTVKFIQGDIMEVDLGSMVEKEGKKLKVAGNIPYYLTSPIIFRLIENRTIVNDAVLMVQLEVAQRMSGKKGTKDYGILALIINFFCEVKFCFKVSANVFYPRPKVESAVVHLFFKETGYSAEEEIMFMKIVKASFGNRRKTLKNSLSNSIFKNLNFSDSGIDLSLRAEQLDSKDFITLARFIIAERQSNV